ncbi:hypothetical protein GIB67_038797 [Kingdonia uniflora]|uniref:SBP-type domain-containing protein n=1 Tax=Kingdonia uniflora TaxID=39325 RepID=A0A7J7M0S8_9MAGN|nr:hypothetical protein GIB67_038797 [Kingdonia uniflora]
MLPSSSLGSLKRPRSHNNGDGTVLCMVDGCTVDVDECKDYLRRSRVCEVHSKSPSVMLGGLEQRFCQRCSSHFPVPLSFDTSRTSFHLLVEFDGLKRNCREGLERHNQRRRKSQPISLDTNLGNSLLNYQGTGLLPFANSQVLRSTSVVNSTLTGIVTPVQDSTSFNRWASHYRGGQNSFPGTFSPNYGGQMQLPFFPIHKASVGNQTAAEASFCPLLLNPITSFESGGTSSDRLQVCSPSSVIISGQTTQIDMSHLMRPHKFSGTFSPNHRDRETQLPFCQPFLQTIASSHDSSRTSIHPLLLSSPSSVTTWCQTSQININHLMYPNTLPAARPVVPPLLPGINYSSLGNYQSHEIVSNANDSHTYCPGQPSRINMKHLVHAETVPFAQPTISSSMPYMNYQAQEMVSKANYSHIHYPGQPSRIDIRHLVHAETVPFAQPTIPSFMPYMNYQSHEIVSNANDSHTYCPGQPSRINMRHLVHAETIPFAQPTIPSSMPYMNYQAQAQEMVSNANYSHIHYPGQPSKINMRHLVHAETVPFTQPTRPSSMPCMNYQSQGKVSNANHPDESSKTPCTINFHSLGSS